MSNVFNVGDVVHRTASTTEKQRRKGMEQGGHYVVKSVMNVDPTWITVEGIVGDFFYTGYFEPSTRTTTAVKNTAALTVQHGGNHYKKLAIQPVEYIMANNIPYMEGNVIKYITRWKDKGGVQDLNKAKHYIELLIENEEKNNESGKA